MMAVGLLTILPMGVIADSKGRKLGILISSIIMVGAMLGLAVIPENYWLLLVVYSIMGFAFPAMAFESLYLNEIGDGRMRSLASMWSSIAWGIGEISFAGVGYLF
jgi:MFS family permease